MTKFNQKVCIEGMEEFVLLNTEAQIQPLDFLLSLKKSKIRVRLNNKSVYLYEYDKHIS